MASMLLKPLFNATIGLLVNKGRSLAAEKLKDGDVADESFRQLIVREMDDIKSKLDGLAGKDLAASMSFFKDGVVHLGKVLDVGTEEKEGSDDPDTTQADGAVGKIMRKIMRKKKTVALTSKELTGLNEEAKEALSDAKKRFKDARRKAVEAFGNSALSTSDRLLAMAIRIMATVLEKVDNPASTLASCKLCLKELHSYSAVRENFSVELKKGIKGSIKSKFGIDERNEIIVAVCQMNRFIYDVTEMANEDFFIARELLIWPCVDVGEERIDPLRDARIARKLLKLGMGQFCVQAWSFGQEGEEEHRLESVTRIATNTKEHFIIADGNNVKVFDNNGQFLSSFPSPSPDRSIKDVATDRDDNMYVLVDAEDRKRGGGDVYVFDTQAKLHHSFRIRPGYDVFSLLVDESKKVLVAVKEIPGKSIVMYKDKSKKNLREMMVEVYENHGRLFHRIEVMCVTPSKCLVSTTGDGHVMVLESISRTLHLFRPKKDYPLERKAQLWQPSPKDTPGAMTFHRASEHLFIASVNEKSEALQVSLYNKDGKFVRSIPLETEPGHKYEITGIVVANNGRIAVAVFEYVFDDDKFQDKHIILIV